MEFGVVVSIAEYGYVEVEADCHVKVKAIAVVCLLMVSMLSVTCFAALNVKT